MVKRKEVKGKSELIGLIKENYNRVSMVCETNKEN